MGVFVMGSEQYTCTIKNVTVFWKGKKVYEHGNSVDGQIEGDKGRRKENKLTEIL
jgi:hypothetical protein